MKDVTIIIGCFLHEQYVQRAYWSARNQEFEGSLEVVVNHDNCQTGQGRGPSIPRNEAIAKANSEYIICLDADDLLPVNYVGELMRGIQRSTTHSGDAFAGCPTQFITGRVLERFYRQPTGIYKLEDIYSTVPIPASAMFPKSLWEKVGGYNESSKMQGLEDWELWVRFLHAGAFYSHTQSTCLLKTNDGVGLFRQTSEQHKQNSIDLINAKYGTHLVLPDVVG